MYVYTKVYLTLKANNGLIIVIWNVSVKMVLQAFTGVVKGMYQNNCMKFFLNWLSFGKHTNMFFFPLNIPYEWKYLLNVALFWLRLKQVVWVKIFIKCSTILIETETSSMSENINEKWFILSFLWISRLELINCLH